MDFTTIEYLKEGNERQKRCYEVLSSQSIFEVLAPFSPVLAGTFPLGIDVEGSDMDIICRSEDLAYFCSRAEVIFGRYAGFSVSHHPQQGVMVVRFLVQGLPVEVYCGQQEPLSSNAYRHMLVEYRLLELFGEDFKDEIIALKRRGWKTEPAFARLLGLEGDPYRAVLGLEGWTAEELEGLRPGK